MENCFLGLCAVGAKTHVEWLGSLHTMEKLREIFPQWKTTSPVYPTYQVFAPLRQRIIREIFL
jgi:hypothetical protein